jgi:hypothetical protein
VTDQLSTTWSDPNPPTPTDPRVKTVLTIAGAILTLVVIATLVIVVISKRDTIFSKSQDNEVALTAANIAGADAFTAPMILGRSAVSETAAAAIQTATGQLPASPDRGVRLVSGSRPGLYGAPPDGNVCDPAALANYLAARPATASAWAGALGTRSEQIPPYLNTLTPVVLTVDTWVTSNRNSNQQAVPYQAVLQAGTAVLVDQAGFPRVHCMSGNPLRPPANVNFEKLKVKGAAWPGYEPQYVVAVSYTDAPASFTDPVPTAPMTELRLVNLATGEELVRPAGGTIVLPPGSPAVLFDSITMNAPPAGDGAPRR